MRGKWLRIPCDCPQNRMVAMIPISPPRNAAGGASHGPQPAQHTPAQPVSPVPEY
ncbi:hypothetical protein LMG29660_03801 [Burkholderia puraquae]|uniref:Uncharacterized protein n=1 Tax=Burkholderia puraquae TaxID=1904757 RepID=A0A6J5E036_9BURK|nr:hypothetical protein LMG29660_03801 [Burkholderia puraquae]